MALDFIVVMTEVMECIGAGLIGICKENIVGWVANQNAIRQECMLKLMRRSILALEPFFLLF